MLAEFNFALSLRVRTHEDDSFETRLPQPDVCPHKVHIGSLDISTIGITLKLPADPNNNSDKPKHIRMAYMPAVVYFS